LIDHVGRALRPSGAVWAVTRFGREVIANVYPRPYQAMPAGPPGPAVSPGDAGGPSSVIASPVDGVVLAVDLRGLESLARRADCVIELAPQVGDFVAAGDPLFRISGSTA